ncbi:enoyl-CoA hydratase/isomerase family protein [Allosalinactinospora lopnorensis]|uniref:enoyl-CoA hydratase/isomerase family protein n=1 Tax=Allosalinactinospora lopnorensis TaxID=1352348 RepID=UPI000623D816|nr:enoyl-CoA hydratase-related protein [Allosalinactinospora lopnorensis]
MTDDVLRHEMYESAAILTMNRPDRRNALNRELGERLIEALTEVGRDPEVRCVVLTGAGGAFCAGDDLDAVADFLAGDRSSGPADEVTGDSHYLRVCEAMVRCPKPVIAGVDGVAAGAGTELACAADYRMASDRARIGSMLVRVGHFGTAVLLPRVVGPSRATEIYLTGRLVEADEAERIGLVHTVVPATEFQASLRALARTLAQGPTKSIAYFKELREAAWGQPVEYGLRLQDLYHIRSHTEIADAEEGPRAFLEGREPVFGGG